MRAKDTTGLTRELWLVKHEMRQQLDEALGVLGLTSAQYSALASLEEQGCLTNAEVARECYVKPQTMIRVLSQLKEQGLLRIDKSASGGREIKYVLTAKAKDLLCRAHQVVHRLEMQMVRGWSEREAQAMLSNLRKMFDNLKSK